MPGPGAFTFHHTSGEAYPIAVAAVEVLNRFLVLRLTNPVHPCAAWFSVSYAKPAASPIRGLDGSEHDAFQNETVENLRADLCGTNWVQTVTIGSVILRAKRPFATADAPQPEWFAVTASGGPVTVTGAAFDPDDAHVLKLEVSREFAADETVTVSYTRPPGERGLWDVDGRQLADLADVAVGAAPAGPPAVTGVALVSDAGGDGTYALGERVRVEVTWDRDVTWDISAANAGIGVRLDVGGVTRRAELETQGRTGGTARALRFAYTVADGDADDDGVRVTPAANGRLVLTRRGATLRGAAGRAAGVSHAGLGPDPQHKVDWRLAPEPPADTAAPALESASVDGKRLTLAFDEALAAADTGGLPFALVVDGIVAGGSVSPSRVAIDGAAVTLHLGTAAAHGQTVTVSYDAAAAGNALRDAVGNAVASFAGAAVENRTPRPAVVATGVLVSSAPAEGDTYGFGETIRVTVSFSEAVDVTGAPRLAIDMDPAHWGRKWAAYESGSGTNALVFAHTVVEPNISTRGIAVLANTLEANGGGIASVSGGAGATLAHAGLGHDPAHKVDWRPALSVADAEGHEGTDSGVEFTVTLSRAAERGVTVDYATADGTATAGEDYTAASGTLTFRAGESSKTVSVPILDDALDEGRETFLLRLSNARGARIADGEATGTILNSDPLQKMWLSRFGRTVADHVTSAVSDRLATPLSGVQVTVGGQNVNLAETGDGAVLTETLTAVARALGAPEGPPPGGDSGFGSPGPGPGPAGIGAGLARWSGAGAGSPDAGGATTRDLSGRELLLGSAFHLARKGEGGVPGLAAWGRVTAGGFDGEAPADGGSVRIDGDVVTGVLGADAEWNRLLAGVAVSVSEGEGTFDQPGVDSGSIESTMTTVSPYARFMVTDRVSVWGLAGWGTGDMTIVQAANDRGQPERVTRTDLEMRLAALGGRGALLTQDEAGGFDLALRADAFWVETESKAVSNEGDTAATASRVRLALEGGRAFLLGGGTLRPSLELGLRHDGGDAETGTGVELGGGVSYADPATGLSVEAKARMLVAHADSDYEEWGVSGAVRLAPGERGRGLSFSLSPTIGATSSASDRLWGARQPGDFAPGGAFEAARGLQGELGYGLSLFGDRFTGTPNLGFGLSDGGARDYRLGWRLTSVVPGDPGFEVSLDATRREAANANEPPEHGMMLRGAIRW